MKEHFNILIIDDEQVVIDSIIKIAGLENYSTDYVLLGKDALLKLKDNSYDLIVCDIMLPEMDGFQILQEIYKLNINTPVIITTGYSTVENAVKSLYLGAIDFIAKPFSIDELISLLHRGINYSNLLKAKMNNLPEGMIIAGPAKYSRLGYSGWMYQDQDGSVLTGATNFFIRTIEPVDKIELLNIGDTLTQATACAKFFSGEYVHSLYSVLSGNIIEINEKVIDQPELLEKDPYFSGWLYRIVPHELEYEIQKLIPCSSDRT